MKYFKTIAKKMLKILFFSTFKKIQTTFHQYQKLYSTPPCTYLQSFEKIYQCVFELQCEN